MLKGSFIDLSHKLYPGKEEYHLNLSTIDTAERYPQYKVDDDFWYILQDLEMSSHCGTHMEFPFHHNKNGETAGNFPFDRLISECILLNYSDKKPNEAVSLDELLSHDKKIQKGDSILFYFGCDVFYRTEKSHERPYIAHDAIKWLVDEKEINLIGSDASGIEIKNVPNQPNHQYLMEHGVPIIEFAANLGEIKRERFILFVLTLPIHGLDSSPVRLAAYIE